MHCDAHETDETRRCPCAEGMEVQHAAALATDAASGSPAPPRLLKKSSLPAAAMSAVWSLAAGGASCAASWQEIRDMAADSHGAIAE